MHAVSRSLHLSESDCRDLLEALFPSLPRTPEPILGEDDNARSKLSF